jgi:hypothetical protein
VKENLTFTGVDSPMSNLLLSVTGGLRSVRERADPRAPAGGDYDCKAGREVQRQETVFDTRARGRIAAAFISRFLTGPLRTNVQVDAPVAFCAANCGGFLVGLAVIELNGPST